MDKNTPEQLLRFQEEFGFDLTPDLTDGQHSKAHSRRPAIPQGSYQEYSRADDEPHLGRKGGEH